MFQMLEYLMTFWYIYGNLKYFSVLVCCTKKIWQPCFIGIFVFVDSEAQPWVAVVNLPLPKIVTIYDSLDRLYERKKIFLLNNKH
jgi:hypothetical protein